jgi:hypothetical protein
MKGEELWPTTRKRPHREQHLNPRQALDGKALTIVLKKVETLFLLTGPFRLQNPGSKIS